MINPVTLPLLFPYLNPDKNFVTSPDSYRDSLGIFVAQFTLRNEVHSCTSGNSTEHFLLLRYPLTIHF
jgi:hypothetical protein